IFHPMTGGSEDDSNGCEVAFIDLEKLFEQSPTIDLLKCDIEGGEKWLLEEYEPLLRRTRTAIFEMHHSICSHKECLDRLERYGLKRERVIMSNQYISLEYFTRAEQHRGAVA